MGYKTAVGMFLSDQMQDAFEDYRALDEPDESDQEAFDMHFAIGMLLSQGRGVEARALIQKYKQLPSRPPPARPVRPAAAAQEPQGNPLYQPKAGDEAAAQKSHASPLSQAKPGDGSPADARPKRDPELEALFDRLDAANQACEKAIERGAEGQRPAGLDGVMQEAGRILGNRGRLPADFAQAKADTKRCAQALEQLHAAVIAAHNQALHAEFMPRLSQLQARAKAAGDKMDTPHWKRLASDVPQLKQQTQMQDRVLLNNAMRLASEPLDFMEAIAGTQKTQLPIANEAQKAHGGLALGTPLKKLIDIMAPAQVAKVSDGPLGYATPGYGGSAWPQVQVSQRGPKQFAFQSTEAKDGKGHKCVITPIGSFELGTITALDKDSITVSGDDGRMRYTGVRHRGDPSWIGKRLLRGISQQTYKEVQLYELEHLVDFSYAFEISAGRVAREVKGLASQVFETPQKAMEALVDRLGDAKALVPVDPMQPLEWATRVTNICARLADLSELRDKGPEKSHCPSGSQARLEGGNVILEPRMKDIHLDTRTIISLDGLPVVFRGFQAAKASAGPLAAELTSKVNGDFYETADLSKNVSFAAIAAGTAVEVVSDPDAQEVWIKVPVSKVPDIGNNLEYFPQVKADSSLFCKVKPTNLKMKA